MQNLKKWSLYFRPKIGIFDTFFKRLCKESFVDLEFYSNFKPVLLCPRRPLKIFAKLQKRPLLIASIVKDTFSGLRQFLATETP